MTENKNNNKTMEAMASDIWALSKSICRAEALADKLEKRQNAFAAFRKDAEAFLKELPETPVDTKNVIVGGMQVPFSEKGVLEVLQKLQELHNSVVEAEDAREILYDCYVDYEELVNMATVWPYTADDAEIAEAETADDAEKDTLEKPVTPEEVQNVLDAFNAKHIPTPEDVYRAMFNNDWHIAPKMPIVQESIRDTEDTEDEIDNLIDELGLAELDVEIGDVTINTGDIIDGDKVTMGDINITFNINGRNVNIDD